MTSLREGKKPLVFIQQQLLNDLYVPDTLLGIQNIKITKQCNERDSYCRGTEFATPKYVALALVKV